MRLVKKKKPYPQSKIIPKQKNEKGAYQKEKKRAKRQ